MYTTSSMWLVRWPEIEGGGEGGGGVEWNGRRGEREEGDRRIGGEFQRATRQPGDLLAEWLTRL